VGALVMKGCTNSRGEGGIVMVYCNHIMLCPSAAVMNGTRRKKVRLEA